MVVLLTAEGDIFLECDFWLIVLETKISHRKGSFTEKFYKEREPTGKWDLLLRLYEAWVHRIRIDGLPEHLQRRVDAL